MPCTAAEPGSKTTASASISAAATQYTVRQPATAATNPETVRANRTPMMRPLMMVPSTRPRSSSSAKVAAIGKRIWAITEVKPTRPMAAAKNPIEGARAAAARPAEVIRASVVISRRRSSRSPRGSSRTRPEA